MILVYRVELLYSGLNCYFSESLFGKITLKIFFPGTSGLISTKLGRKHWILKPIIFYSNDNLWLTLTYFTTRSNFAT